MVRKLNLGASNPTGQYKREPWINFDVVPHDRIHVVGSGTLMPFKDASFDEIHCVHVLEHVTRNLYPIMLAEMHRVLKPGASAFVEVPDFQGVVQKLHHAFNNRQVRDIHIWTTSTYGKNEREGMAHYWGFYEELLVQAFRNAGFDKAVRETTMISSHYKQEPVLLVKGTK